MQSAHVNLGVALAKKGDWDGAIAGARGSAFEPEYLSNAHFGLGVALGHKGDLDGADRGIP